MFADTKTNNGSRRCEKTGTAEIVSQLRLFFVCMHLAFGKMSLLDQNNNEGKSQWEEEEKESQLGNR